MKYPIDPIGNRNCDILACRPVRQPTAPLCVAEYNSLEYRIVYEQVSCTKSSISKITSLCYTHKENNPNPIYFSSESGLVFSFT